MPRFDFSVRPVSAEQIWDSYRHYGQAAEDLLRLQERLAARTLELWVQNGDERLDNAMVEQTQEVSRVYHAAYETAEQAAAAAAISFAFSKEHIIEGAYAEKTARDFTALAASIVPQPPEA